jgi:uncharacterized repeat protein (TIGR03803 family)
MRYLLSFIAAGVVAGAPPLASAASTLPSRLPVFVAAPAAVAPGTERVLYRFRGASDGSNPHAGLVETGGNFYGTTELGGLGKGTIFEITAKGQERVLYRFKGGPGDGANPLAALTVFGSDLYGTTLSGGVVKYGGLGVGTVFSTTLAGQEKMLYAFEPVKRDANSPNAALIAVGGALWGTTMHGGADFGGTLFKLTAPATEQILYSFKTDEALVKGTDGAGPAGQLIFTSGAFYGTTVYGGPSGNGTAFEVTVAGKERLLHEFAGAPDGSGPRSALSDVGGLLYGTTTFGGAHNAGAVFTIDPKTAKERVIYSFTGAADGAEPFASLTYLDGSFYGTTLYGGDLQGCNNGGCGTVFQITPAGKLRTLYAFKDGSDGAQPYGELLYSGGLLYGTTGSGGSAAGFGTVFTVVP